MDDLEQYLAALHALEECSRNACEDLAVAEKQAFWVPTRYEVDYLPGLRKVGLAVRDEVTLQNVADLHIHTAASDGGEVASMLERAVEQRLDAVAVTDHDTIEGAKSARAFAHRHKLALAVIPGVEVSTAQGHVGALFVMQDFPTGLPMRTAIEMIHDVGGLAVAHHPFVPRILEILAGHPLGAGESFLDLPFDAVEVTNAVPGIGTRCNIRTHQLVRDAGCTLGFTGGSDAHDPFQVGKGLTYYAGNQGVLSLRRGIELGTTLGAEAYWTTAEKIQYYRRLGKRLLASPMRSPTNFRVERVPLMKQVLASARSHTRNARMALRNDILEELLDHLRKGFSTCRNRRFARWLDEVLEPADKVEKRRAEVAANNAISPAGQQMRSVRDRTVARLQELVRDIRHYEKHA